MAGYEREYTIALDHHTRLRVGHTTIRGTPVEFVVQLEHRLDGEWYAVARFDHNPDLEAGHDVTEEGLHLDVYRDGEKHDVEREFPAVNINDAIAYWESHLKRNADEYVRRFQQWHETNPDRRNDYP